MIEEKAFQELHPQAYRWALSLCKDDPAAAEDVLQDVYIKIWERKAVFQHQSGLRTWLFALIRNTAIDRFRKKSNLVLESLEKEPLLNVVEPLHEAPDPAWEQLLSQLSLMQRATLQLVFYHDLTLEETAKILDVTLGTVSTHYKRGKEQLRKLIEQNHLEQKLRGYGR